MPQKENLGNKLKSLVKALRLLKLFAQRKSWNVNELITTLGFHKSTVQRLVTTLENEGFLERVYPHKGMYQLGPQILHLGTVASHSSDLRTIAQPYLDRLCSKTQETTHLCVVSKFQCYYLEKIDSPRSIRLVTFVGQRMPLHSTGVGKALMSGMSIKEIDRVIADQGLKRFTPNTLTDRDSLLAELTRIRETGLSFDKEEMEMGLRCAAAPIFDSSGKVVAAVSISGPVQRMGDQILPEFSRLVRKTALQISERLGYIPLDKRNDSA
jgi:DNA-binding IclR family transcriptional regulator